MHTNSQLIQHLGTSKSTGHLYQICVQAERQGRSTNMFCLLPRSRREDIDMLATLCITHKFGRRFNKVNFQTVSVIIGTLRLFLRLSFSIAVGHVFGTRAGQFMMDEPSMSPRMMEPHTSLPSTPRPEDGDHNDAESGLAGTPQKSLPPSGGFTVCVCVC